MSVPALLCLILLGQPASAPPPWRRAAEAAPWRLDEPWANPPPAVPDATNERVRKIADVHYGPDVRHTLDLYLPSGDGPHPVFAFVHGGEFFEGDKAQHEAKGRAFARAGIAFAALNHRLAPAVRHPEHVRDIARALAWLREHAAELNLDPTKISVSGHSAGAHLAALVATDERHLHAWGMRPKDLAGVVLLDGAGYDIPLRVRRTLPEIRKDYERAFGSSPRSWERASPPRNVSQGEPLPPFLLFYAGTARSPRVQALAFARVLRAAGAHAQLVHVPERNHVTLEKKLGEPKDPAFAEILKFLRG